MKNLFCLLLAICFTGYFSLNAQTIEIECYKTYVNKGKRAYKQGDYARAINSYIFARWCPESKTTGEVDRLISSTLKTWVDSLNTVKEQETLQKNIAEYRLVIADSLRNVAESLKNLANRQKDTAQFNSRLFYGYFVADDAVRDLENGKLKTGLAKAFHAYDTLLQTSTPTPPSVYQAFGNAVFKNFGKILDYRHPGGLIDIAFSKDGRRLFTLGRDASLAIWEYERDRLALFDVVFTNPPVDRGYMLSADFKVGNDQIAYSYQNNFAGFKTFRDSLTIALQEKHTDAIIKTKWTSAGQILTASRDGKAALWDDKGRFIQFLITDDLPLVDLTLSGDGKFALARTMRSLYYWETNQTEPLAPLFKTDTALIYTATLSPDGNSILASVNTSVKLWKYGSLQEIDLPSLESPALALQFAPDNSRFLVGAQNGFVQSWSNENGEWKLDKLEPLHQKPVDQFAFNKNARYFVSLGLDTAVHILGAAEKNVIYQAHNAPVASISFSPKQDSVFLSSSQDGTAKLWLTSGDLIMNMNIGRAVTKALFSPEGACILAADEDGRLFFTPTFEHIYQKIKQKEMITPSVRNEIKQGIAQLLGN